MNKINIELTEDQYNYLRNMIFVESLSLASNVKEKPEHEYFKNQLAFNKRLLTVIRKAKN